MSNEARNYIKLKDQLEELKLKQVLLHLDEVIDLVNTNNTSLVEALLRLTEYEIIAKEERVINSCVKTAGFPFLKTFDDFDFDFQPGVNKKQLLGFKDKRFIENIENILFLGNPGVGKTHLATAIGIEAAKDHRSTYFIGCNDLILQLKKAHLENRLEQRLKFFSRMKLLIIDEVGYLPMDAEASKLFFQLIARRYEKHSTIITTNKPLQEWTDTFGDPVIANAILDRLLHHSHVIKIVGPSYRTRDILQQTARDKS